MFKRFLSPMGGTVGKNIKLPKLPKWKKEVKTPKNIWRNWEQ